MRRCRHIFRMERKMILWQKCPVCDGAGNVARPPWVAGDVPEWMSGRSFYTCAKCEGNGVIPTPTQEFIEESH